MAQRHRFQQGSLLKRQHGKHLVWVAFWREKGRGRSKVLGKVSELTEGAATAELARIVAPLNAGINPGSSWTFEQYVEQTFLPLQASVWKESTAETSEQRIRQHLIPAFGKLALAEITRPMMQAFISQVSPLQTVSVVRHLRWDLNQIFRLANADNLIPTNPAAELRVSDRLCKEGRQIRALSEGQVLDMLGVLPLRERLVCRLGLFEGLRVGEILALQWGDIEGRALQVRRRVYMGRINTPKTKIRECAVSAGTVALLAQWRRRAEWIEPGDFLFPSENRKSPMRPENIWKNNVRPLLTPLGLGWVTYHQLRHTNGTLMKKAGADAKVGADQRGHGIGVSLQVYTHSDLEEKREALDLLEASIGKAQKRAKARRTKTA